MTQFDTKYYVVKRDYSWKNDGPRFIGFGPKNAIAHSFTGSRDKQYVSVPLIFKSDEIDLRRQNNHPGEIGDINVSGGRFLVKEWVRNLFFSRPIYGLQVVPAVFEDIYGNYHEPLWYLHFYHTLECWHRERSIRAYPDLEYEEGEDIELERFSLDENILSPMPLEKRLIFKIVETASPPVTIFHESLVEKFIAKNATGARYFRVDQYTSGMEVE